MKKKVAAIALSMAMLGSFFAYADTTQSTQKAVSEQTMESSKSQGPGTRGWKQESGLWKYENEDGSYIVNNWKEYDGDWYYFDANGNMTTNYITPDNYYIDFSGKRMTDTKINEELMEQKSAGTTLIVFSKTSHVLQLWKNSTKIHQCLAASGSTVNTDKVQEGDRATPVGEFYLCLKNGGSQFYKALGVSYPAIEDAERGLAAGMINVNDYNQIVSANNRKVTPNWKTALGGYIEIHGCRRNTDLTAGCIEVLNKDMDVLWAHASHGSIILIQE